MSRYYSGDPEQDLLRYLRDMDRMEAMLPRCIICGAPVYDPIVDFREAVCQDCRKEMEDKDDSVE